MRKNGGLERNFSDAEKTKTTAIGALAQRALGDAIALTMWESPGNYAETCAAVQHCGGYLPKWAYLRQVSCSSVCRCSGSHPTLASQVRARVLQGKDHEEIHRQCVADLAALAEALGQPGVGPYLLGPRPSHGDATVLSVLLFSLHAPYADPVWEGKTLGNLVAAHASLQAYYKGCVPTLVASGKMLRPQDLTPLEGHFVPVIPKVLHSPLTHARPSHLAPHF